MWPFNKTHNLLELLPDGCCDYHSHILPGVDDGISTLEESLVVLEEYEKAGIRELWLTPHIMEDCPNTTHDLKKAFEELSDAYSGNVVLHLASENMLDILFQERLLSGDLLPIGEDGTHLLVETSYLNPPMGLNSFFDAIRKAGYFSVLAHPERYVYMDEEDYAELKKSGVLFQLNIASLAGMYGHQARKKAEYLLSKGWYDIAGTDVHRLVQFKKMAALKTEISPGKVQSMEKI